MNSSRYEELKKRFPEQDDYSIAKCLEAELNLERAFADAFIQHAKFAAIYQDPTEEF